MHEDEEELQLSDDETFNKPEPELNPEEIARMQQEKAQKKKLKKEKKLHGKEMDDVKAELQDLLFEADSKKINSKIKKEQKENMLIEEIQAAQQPAPIFELEEEKTETLSFLGKSLTKKILKEDTDLVDVEVIGEPKNFASRKQRKRNPSVQSKSSRASSKKVKK